MRKMMISLVLVLTLSACAEAQYNATVTLKIGDPAPPIKVQSWVRGKPITRFEKDKVYVLDFWATWCGGCIVSFPKISTIGEKYNDRVVFVCVDTYEQIGDTKVPDPEAMVKEFLKTAPGQKLKLDVCVDGNDKLMWDAWIKPIRRTGLPTTFVIDQEGKVAWIDVNLDHLPWVLDQVLAKKWDRQKAAEIMRQKDAIEDMFFKSLNIEGDDHTKICQAMLAACEALEKEFPDRTDASAFYKFMALMDLDVSKVPNLLEKMAENPLCRYINLSDAAGLYSQKKGLTKRDYVAIAKVQERLLMNEYPGAGQGGKSISAYEELASTYNKAGEPAKVVASLQKGIALAKQQKAPADQIQKLQVALDNYKSVGAEP